MEPGFQPRAPQPRTGMDVVRDYGTVSSRMVRLFRETKPWARFVGIYSLAMAGLGFLLALLCAYGAVAGHAPAAILLSAALFYVVVSLVSLFWGYFANQYASAIDSIETGRGRAIEAALAHQRDVWRMMGGLAGLSALLILVSITLSVLFGVGALLLEGEQPQAGTGAAAGRPAPRSFWEKLILPDPFSELDAGCNLSDPDFLCLVQEDGSVKALRKPEASFSIIESRRFRAFWVSPGGDGEWEFMFEGPSGQALEVGTYENARWEVARGEHVPGLRIAPRGAVCPSATGRFRVLEADGSRFVADFEQVCAGTGERLFGRLAVAER